MTSGVYSRPTSKTRLETLWESTPVGLGLVIVLLGGIFTLFGGGIGCAFMLAKMESSLDSTKATCERIEKRLDKMTDDYEPRLRALEQKGKP